jgi:hypothetical protein
MLEHFSKTDEDLGRKKVLKILVDHLPLSQNHSLYRD